jgi:hypothetical protein
MHKIIGVTLERSARTFLGSDLNPRYDGEATVATEIGVESFPLADWLVGEDTQP